MERFYRWLESFGKRKADNLALERFKRENPEFFQSRYVEKRYLWRMDKWHDGRMNGFGRV